MKTNQSFLSDVAGPKQESSIKQKLAYEWKNIYRTLASIDIEGKGKVSTSEFQVSVTKNRVYMTREEFKKIQTLFGEENGEVINYS